MQKCIGYLKQNVHAFKLSYNRTIQ